MAWTGGLAPNIFHPVPDSAQAPDEIVKVLAGRTGDDFLRDIPGGGRLPQAARGGQGRRALLYADRFDDSRTLEDCRDA